LRKDFTRRNKYSSANRSHAITVRLADFFKATGINLLAVMTILQSYSLISDSLGPSGVRDGNRSDMDLKLISKW